MKPHKETTKRPAGAVIGAAFATLAVAAMATPALAEGSATCANRDKVVSALSEVYAENPVSIGLTEEGAVIEVMASSEGSFTIVVTHPNGLTCPIAAGKAWQTVAAKVTGDGV